MGQSVSRTDYVWTYTEQPHLSRREAIVKAHPEIKQLFGVDESFKYVVTACVLLQTFAAFLLRDSDWLLICLQAYFFGGVINHALTLAIHDISHNTAFGNKKPMANRIFGIFANLPIAVPISISFKKYHVEHHRYLSEDGLDTDVPTLLEAQLFSNSLTKMLWLFLQPFFYAFRPLIIYKKVPTDLEILNLIVQVIYDLLILYYLGKKSLFYLLFGTFITMGLHPSAGHFISEHYLFNKDCQQETYSYYGPWNLVTYNVGYHVEHHDFPYIPGRNLPKVREIAPEFYDNLQKHTSMLKILYDFVFDPTVGPYARIKRKASVEQNMYGNNMLLPYIHGFFNYFGIPHIVSFIEEKIWGCKKLNKCL
uniref:sphingolipid 4-desaturase n=1 Tax=Parastrongyloides trichosuri TaxID=131310 RepID=A0A0N4Z0A9_PARTI